MSVVQDIKEPLDIQVNHRRILHHWREFRPKLVQDLERSGELDAVVGNLEQTVLEKRDALVERGMSLNRADELLRSMWMISDGDS